jgi:His-Xaa-Ser system radical SAM maturase HxsC
MLARQTNALIAGTTQPLLGKVADLRDFASGLHGPERLILDLRAIPDSCDTGALLDLPWLGFLARSGDARLEQLQGRCTLSALADDAVVSSGDAVRIVPGARQVAVWYRRGSNSNALFVTERCNNYCLMCSQPPRNVDDDWRISELYKLLPLVDRCDRWLGITGGEPTLLDRALYDLIRACARELPDTGLHVLSNGRRFVDRVYALAACEVHADLTWGIPLYGDVAHLHDYVVQERGAFDDTVRGLYNLAAANQSIEIRIVLVRPTLARLAHLSNYIARNFPFVGHVALMGLEPQGFARANFDLLWQDPMDYQDVLAEAVAILHNAGLRTSIYNLPLCVLPSQLWPFAKRSISDWKRMDLPECSRCQAQQKCCGVFSSFTPQWRSRGISPISSIETEIV